MVFLSSLVYPGLDFLWTTRRVFLKKRRTLTLPVHLVYSGVLVESELLICFCHFVSKTLVTLCSLLCMSGLHSFDYHYYLGSLDYSIKLRGWYSTNINWICCIFCKPSAWLLTKKQIIMLLGNSDDDDVQSWA